MGYYKEETLKGQESEWQAEGKINFTFKDT